MLCAVGRYDGYVRNAIEGSSVRPEDDFEPRGSYARAGDDAADCAMVRCLFDGEC
jgi:hypothetical protein